MMMITELEVTVLTYLGLGLLCELSNDITNLQSAVVTHTYTHTHQHTHAINDWNHVRLVLTSACYIET